MRGWFWLHLATKTLQDEPQGVAAMLTAEVEVQ